MCEWMLRGQPYSIELENSTIHGLIGGELKSPAHEWQPFERAAGQERWNGKRLGHKKIKPHMFV